MNNEITKTLAKKIVLGTVQFGLDYGISNSKGQTSSEEVKEILKTASGSGINFLDTAYAYGNSEKVLGDCPLSAEFEVISKFPKLSPNQTIEQCLSESLASLNRKGLYAYLAHDADFINDASLWNQLLELKQRGLVSKIGYSLYTPDQLKKLLQRGFIPDIVQLPYNVFDRRFESLIPMLTTLGTEVHIRSAFLQGLFFVDPHNLPEHFYPVKHLLNRIRKKFPDTETLAGSLINFCLRKPFIDKVVIGINHHTQLSSNIANLGLLSDDLDSDEFIVTDESVLLPYHWPKIRL